MITIFSFTLISNLFITSALAAPAEKWIAEKASLSFDTFIRVKIPAQVVEAEDARIVGESTAFIQSLLYTANKSMLFQGEFSSEAGLRTTILKELCTSEHEVELTPVRHEGSKGERGFTSKIKPFTVSISGKTLKADSAKPFSIFLVCGKQL